MSEIQKDIRDTAAWMKILLIATKGFGQMTSNYTCFANSWFSSVKTSE